MKYLLYLLAAILLPAPESRAQTISFELGGRAGIPSSQPLERDLNGAGSVFSSFQSGATHFLAGPGGAVVRFRPFAIAGASFQKFTDKSESRVTELSTGQEVSRYTSRGPLTLGEERTGLVLGGGAEARLTHFRIAPEFRYIQRPNPITNAGVIIPSTQFEFLIGVAYRFSR